MKRKYDISLLHCSGISYILCNTGAGPPAVARLDQEALEKPPALRQATSCAQQHESKVLPTEWGGCMQNSNSVSPSKKKKKNIFIHPLIYPVLSAVTSAEAG